MSHYLNRTAVTCWGGWGVLKVRITVFVILRSLPFFTEMMTASVTPWFLSSLMISSLVQQARSRDRTAPLRELRLLCGETFTGISASDVIPRSISEYFLLFDWTSKSPRWSPFTMSRVPIWAFGDLPIAKTETWSNDCRLSSLDWITSHLWKCSVTISSSDLLESGQLLFVWCWLLFWVCEEAVMASSKRMKGCTMESATPYSRRIAHMQNRDLHGNGKLTHPHFSLPHQFYPSPSVPIRYGFRPRGIWFPSPSVTTRPSFHTDPFCNP